MACYEINFDGIVGPTHHYGGLGIGNLASQRHKYQTSNPRAAALQGLAKMKMLADMGLRQAVLPPHDRPDVAALRRVGFSGSDQRVLTDASRDAPELLLASASASAMWAANAATVSPSADTADGLVHLTPANLVSQWHRSIETRTTHAVLRAIFADAAHFAVHDPLPATWRFGDEGAANHTLLCASHGGPGIEVFAYGRDGDATRDTQRFPARQSRDASHAVARLHGLRMRRTLFVQQSAAAIDAGVFHNDVIAVGNEGVLLCHEHAFAGGDADIDAIARLYRDVTGVELCTLVIPDREVSLTDAVDTYLFNSQLVTLPTGKMALICPRDCEARDSTCQCVERLVAADNPIAEAHYVDVRQSMQNGGGPACLRLRVVLTDAELAAAHQPVMFNDALHAKLTAWVNAHYRDELSPADLADAHLLIEMRDALDELSRLLQLGAIYDFQR